MLSQVMMKLSDGEEFILLIILWCNLLLFFNAIAIKAEKNILALH